MRTLKRHLLRVYLPCWVFAWALFPLPGESPELLGHPTLTEQTLRAFRTYINETDARNAKSLASGNFLWIDDSRSARKSRYVSKAEHGEILIERIKNTAVSTETPGE